MDCHDNCHDSPDQQTRPRLMDVDLHPLNSNKESPELSSGSDCSPIRYVRSAVHRLASTREGKCNKILPNGFPCRRSESYKNTR